MSNPTQELLRTGVLTSLVERSRSRPGRTALMKYAYLLQSVRHVPLGYRFHLYNYGPYDETVLADAHRAVASGLLDSRLITFQGGGYGYEFALGKCYEDAKHRLASVTKSFSDDIDWVINRFGIESASRLELISTIVFATCDKRARIEGAELVERVHEIKPHFTKEVIGQTSEDLRSILECVTCDEEDDN
jgi:uncharacterized protein YwgA